MLYEYTAATLEGEAKTGSIEAINVDVAINALQAKGLVITDIKSAKQSGSVLESLGQLKFFNKVKRKDVVILSRQLASVLLGIFSQRLVPRISGGRIPAYELLISTPAVRTLIRERRTHEIDTIIETNYEIGMVSLNRSLAALVRGGEITMKDAVTHSLNPQELESLV